MVWRPPRFADKNRLCVSRDPWPPPRKTTLLLALQNSEATQVLARWESKMHPKIFGARLSRCPYLYLKQSTLLRKMIWLSLKLFDDRMHWLQKSLQQLLFFLVKNKTGIAAKKLCWQTLLNSWLACRIMTKTTFKLRLSKSCDLMFQNLNSILRMLLKFLLQLLVFALGFSLSMPIHRTKTKSDCKIVDSSQILSANQINKKITIVLFSVSVSLSLRTKNKDIFSCSCQ